MSSEKVFVTGVTGYLGGAIATRLARAGYQVFGLTRVSDRAGVLAAAGIHPVLGSLAKPDTFMAALKNCDAAIHVALDPTDVVRQDQRALEAVRLGAMDGRVRRFLYTSNAWVHGDTGDAVKNEASELNPLDLVRWRAAHEDVALDLSEHDLKVVVLRPAIVYGGAGGIVGAMFAEAHEQNVVHYPGTGAQYWSLIHRDDVAEAYLRALERANGGERYLLTDGAPATARQIATAIATTTGVQARSQDAADVLKQSGLRGRALLASQRLSSDRAHLELGWTPRHTSFLDEVGQLDIEFLDTRSTPVA